MISRILRRAVLVVLGVVASGFAAGHSSAQTTLIDTFTNATNYSFATAPRTYIGDAFTNNVLPANTTQFQVTGGNVVLLSGAAVTYTDIQMRIQLWNTVSPASTTAVFSNPLSLIVIDLGGGNLALNTPYTVAFTLSGTLPALLGGAGTNWGVTINFQGSTAVGTPVADTTNLSPAIAYNTGTTGFAAGTITTGGPPNFGYFRNVEGQTNFNFIAGDQRTLGVTNQGVGFSLTGNPVVAAAPEPGTYACLISLGLLASGVYLRRRRLAAAV